VEIPVLSQGGCRAIITLRIIFLEEEFGGDSGTGGAAIGVY
jgi:hypothetical protein